jgi:hypothetical protein
MEVDTFWPEENGIVTVLNPPQRSEGLRWISSPLDVRMCTPTTFDTFGFESNGKNIFSNQQHHLIGRRFYAGNVPEKDCFEVEEERGQTLFPKTKRIARKAESVFEEEEKKDKERAKKPR